MLAPTRELAAQILEDLNDLARAHAVTAAAVFGGVGMGPQEHAFRSGVDVSIATPGRLLDHFRMPYAKLAGLEFLVLDEADRMLDMGFLPDIRRVLRHLPARRQTLFFSATMPAPIRDADARDAPEPGRDQPRARRPRRRSASPRRCTRWRRSSSRRCSSRCSSAARSKEALVFTRTKHRANRLADVPGQARDQGGADSRQPVAGAADRGAGRVQERQVPGAGGDRHRRARHRRRGAGPRGQLRRARGARGLHPPRRPHGARRGDAGDAFTFVSPEEEGELRAIERAIGKRLPRVTVPDFDYDAKPEARFEIPLAERIAAIRAKKAEDRARAKANAERREAHQAGAGHGRRPRPARPVVPARFRRGAHRRAVHRRVNGAATTGAIGLGNPQD